MQHSLRLKLACLGGVIGIAIICAVTSSVLLAREVGRELEAIEQRYVPRVRLGAELSAGLEQLRRNVQDAVAIRDVDGVATAVARKDGLLRTLHDASGAVDVTSAAALRDAIELYAATARDVAERLIRGETGEEIVASVAIMQARQSAARDLVETVSRVDRDELANAFGAARHAEARAVTDQVWIGIVLLGVALFALLGVGRSVLRAVEELSAGFRRFGDGDFDSPIRVTSRDELSVVADKANAMATKLASAMTELRAAEARFRAFLESAPDAMVIVDAHGEIVLVNARTEALFGYPRGDLLGKKVEMLMPARVGERHDHHRTNYFVEPKVRVMGDGRELFGKRKDGSEFAVEISLSPLEMADGLLVSSAIRDVTARKRIETALRASNAELEAFSYSVAHDLRAPLRGINGFSRALLEDCSEKLEADGKDYLHRIAAAAQRMGELIDALLVLSRVSRSELRHVAVSISALAETVVRQLRASQPERDVEVIIADNLTVTGDPPLLLAMLENLLGNAWKFSAKKPRARVEVGVERKGGGLAYFVRDNGAGFDMLYVDKLFAPFQRLHSPAEFPGTGIGLATVQRIVNRHGGRIWAVSEPDRGATFYFDLVNPEEGRTS